MIKEAETKRNGSETDSRFSLGSARPLARRYLVGVSMSERRVVLPGAVGGPVLIHGGGGRSFAQQAALCRKASTQVIGKHIAAKI